MRGLSILIVLLRNEIRDRAHLLIAAAASGVLLLALPWLPGLGDPDPGDVRSLGAWILATVLGGATAVSLGATMIGTELAEGRLGYYLSQPMSPMLLWWSKLTGAFATTFGIVILILGPAFALHLGSPWFVPLLEEPWLLAAIPLILLTLILVAHTAGTILRSRTAWMAIDAIGLLVVCILAWWAPASLLASGAFDQLARLLLWMLVGVTAAMALAGAVQVSIGRTDLHRSHRTLSITTWTLLTGVTLVAMLSTHRTLNPSPSRLQGIGPVTVAPAGAWLAVSGSTSTGSLFPPSALIDTETSRHTSLGLFYPWHHSNQVAFSNDGARALVLETGSIFAESPVRPVHWRLEPETIERAPSPLTVESMLGEVVAVTADVSRLASYERSLLTAYDLVDGRQLGSFRVKAGHAALCFETPDLLRLYLAPPATGLPDPPSHAEIEIAELDLESHERRTTGWIDLIDAEPDSVWGIDLGPAGRSALITYTTPRTEPDQEQADAELLPGSSYRRALRYTLVDATTGQPGLPEVSEALQRARTAMLLSDGSLVTTTREDGALQLELIDLETGWPRAMSLGEAHHALLHGENTSGELLLSLTEGPDSWQITRAIWIDLETLGIEPVPDGLLPASRPTELFNNAPTPVLPPGPLTNRLFVDKDRRHLILIDAEGSHRVLAGAD